MRAQLADWLEHTVDPRKLHKRTALERFAEERNHLVPLPRHPYDTACVVYRVCGIDGFVAWAGNHYAVPYDHVTEILPLRITQRELCSCTPPTCAASPATSWGRAGPACGSTPPGCPPPGDGARSISTSFSSRSTTWASTPPSSLA
jgi:hypothetical protein